MACLLLPVAGCGDSSDLNLVPVHGTVTCAGKAVPGLFITFLPEKGRPSWALSDESGNYQATYTTDKKGVQAGMCRVWVTFKPQNEEQATAIMNGQDPFAQWAELLKKYGRTRIASRAIRIKQELDLIGKTVGVK